MKLHKRYGGSFSDEDEMDESSKSSIPRFGV